jgi:hypothetical protein
MGLAEYSSSTVSVVRPGRMAFASLLANWIAPRVWPELPVLMLP